jgi:hypothetical protein
MKSLRTIISLSMLLSATNVMRASPGINISLDIDTTLALVTKQITNTITEQLPRINYTGLAFLAGGAGICTSYNGIKHIYKGIDEEKKTTTLTGVAELTTGLSITTISVLLIQRLWK